jgi:hypothetical protein
MSDLTTQVLIEIRDEVRELRGEVGGLRGEVGGLRGEVGGLRGEVNELRQRQVESEIRIATGITDVIGVIGQVRDAILEDRRFAARVDDHERRITALEQRPGE